MEKLQKLYMESGITLAKLSELSGISVSTVHRYVTGRVKERSSIYYDPIYLALQNLHPQEEESDETQSVKVDVDVDVLKERMMVNGIKENKNCDTTILNTYPSQNQRVPHKGEIWYIKSTYTVGKEMWSGSQNRPCIVIQNAKLGNIGTFLCVNLTKQPKELENPTFVTIQTNVVSTAICSQVNSVSKDRFVNCVGSVTEVEMSLIERAVLTAFDIKINPKSDVQHLPDYIAIKTELMVYKQLYQDYIKIQSIK